jgi:hypothetical protein
LSDISTDGCKLGGADGSSDQTHRLQRAPGVGLFGLSSVAGFTFAFHRTARVEVFIVAISEDAKFGAAVEAGCSTGPLAVQQSPAGDLERRFGTQIIEIVGEPALVETIPH